MADSPGGCPSPNRFRVWNVSFRPLVFVIGLTVGDYLLWNWSLNGNHDVLALVAGLTLPPLAVACVWLAAVDVARLLASRAVRPGARGRAGTDAQKPSAQGQSPAGDSGADAPPSRKMAA